MKVRIDTVEVSSLRSAVEIRFGKTVKTPRDFSSLAEDVSVVTGHSLSETTLQRVWLYKSGYKTISNHSLDVLAKYVGARDWEYFLVNIDKMNGTESDMFPDNSIKVATLAVGTLIRIAWQPDRECVLKYLGNYRFEAVETKNSKISSGDSFTCTSFQLGHEVRMDNLIRGFDELTYIAGSRSGLTALEILEK